MLPEDWHAYIKCRRVINGEEKLEDINVSSFPELKKKTRQDIAKRYRKDATSLVEKKRLSMKEAMAKLGNLGGRR